MNQYKKKIITLLLACWSGTILEWYDFAVYGFLAPTISSLFFPHESQSLSLILTYAVFAIGYLVRPLGGIICGHIGDIKGRKTTLIITILLMSISTFLVGILPTYQSIGVMAPLLLLILRILQGIAAGGETIGATTFIFESVSPNKQAISSTLIYIGTGLGITCASFVITLAHSYFTATQFTQFGWRIPFLLALLSTVIGPTLRLKTAETLQIAQNNFLNTKDGQSRQQPKRIPIIEVWHHHKGLVIKILFLFAPGAVAFYMGFIFMPGLLIKTTHISPQKIMHINTMATLLVLILSLVFAWLAEIFGYKRILVIGLVSMLISSIPVYTLLSQPSIYAITEGQIILAIILANITGPLMAFSMKQVPIQLRYTLMAVAYNICYSILGGTAPVIGSILNHTLQHFTALGLYQMVITVMSLIAVYSLRSNTPNYTCKKIKSSEMNQTSSS